MTTASAEQTHSQRTVTNRTPIVPYIATWSEEYEPSLKLVERPGIGLGFADETAADRDRDGVLWNRTVMLPGQGRPRFAVIHPLRQRRVMRRLFCQVCGNPADRDEQGVLWLLPDLRDSQVGWPEGMIVAEPPVCAACAVLAGRLCPHLRRGNVMVRARRFPLSGVKGFVYRPGRPHPVLLRDDLVSYDSAALLRWTLAEQQLRTLHGCTIITNDLA
ncbi:MAG TPA: hypothetical protein VFX16_27080 [Pseudonocardiaceae bacterium]|nr:hypothetical protein [Pseudonocardiaceae bacterium]